MPENRRRRDGGAG